VRDGRFLHARLRVPLGIAAFPAPAVVFEGETFLQKPGRLAPRGIYVRLALATNEIVTVAV
jgi:hypothetical protein